MDWTEMQPEMFDTDAQPVQEALFAAPDKCGTPDLFRLPDRLARPAPQTRPTAAGSSAM